MTEIEKALWKLLDDIDTAGDMFKPEQTGYSEYVQRKCEEREKYIVSDGYELFLPEDFPKQDVSKQEAELYVSEGSENG